MKHILRTLWPVLLMAALSLISGVFVESPPYPVSPVHGSVVLLLLLLFWYCSAFGRVQRSPRYFAAGTGFGFLAMADGLLPDLWLRWAGVSLFGLGLTQVLAVLLPWRLFQSGYRLSVAAALIVAISILPLAATPYYSISPLTTSILGIFGVTGLVVAGWKSVFHKGNVTVATAATVIFFVLLAAALLVATFTALLDMVAYRQKAEEYLLYALILLCTGVVADKIGGEQQLRSGPHMDLDASLTDPLSGLGNRRALELYGPQLISASHAAGRAVSLILTDIDHFKRVNDNYGHLAGDTVLRHTATRLKAVVRKSDLVARYGGEEFVIILPGSPLAPALRLAEQMRAAIEAEVVVHDGLELKRTASFGVATAFPEEPTSLSDLIERADRNLYRAKGEGRNKVLADALPPDTF